MRRFIFEVAGSISRRSWHRFSFVLHHGGRFLVTTENTFEIEGESKPALTAVALAMRIAS